MSRFGCVGRGAVVYLCVLVFVGTRADGEDARTPRFTSIQLAGTWTLSLPAGFKYEITLTSEGEASLRFHGDGLVFNGLYELRGKHLVMTQAVDEKMTAFEWVISKDPEMIVLVAQPSTGSVYIGATLANRRPPTPESAEAALPRAVAAAGWATIRGEVVVEGDLPPIQYLVRKRDPIYAMQSRNDSIAGVPRRQVGTHDADVIDSSLLVDDKTRGLANVFVYLRKRPANVRPEADRIPEEALEFTRTEWHFEPRLLFVRTHQPIRVTAGAPDIIFNLHTQPLRNTPINQLIGGTHRPEAVVKFEQAEILPIRVVDDMKTSARAHWLVLDHPYAAVTAVDGKFEIRDLPYGEHEVIVWHERVGYLAKKYRLNVGPDSEKQSIRVKVKSERLKPK